MQESIRDVLRTNLLETAPVIISKYTNKTWLKKSLKRNNYVGPNGNEVIAYVWKWKWGLKYSEHEGGDVEVRVSDWDEAEECSSPRCSRKIVHIFYVHDKADNQVKGYGFDHAHLALGIEKELSQSLINKIKNAVSIPPGQKDLSKVDEKRLARVFKRYQRTSGKTPVEASQKLDRWYGVQAQFDSPLFYHTEDKRYVYLEGGKMTPAIIKRVTKLIPAFKKVDKGQAIKLYKIDKGNMKIHHFAKNDLGDATMAARQARLPFSSKYLWAVNMKKKLVMRVTAGSIIEDPEFTKLFPDWEVGGVELAKKFRGE